MENYIVYTDDYDNYQILIVNRNKNTWHFFAEFKSQENAQYTCDLLNKEADRIRELRESDNDS